MELTRCLLLNPGLLEFRERVSKVAGLQRRVSRFSMLCMTEEQRPPHTKLKSDNVKVQPTTFAGAYSP